MKKNWILIITILFVFIIFLFIWKLPRNYKTSYKNNDFMVTEEYNKKLKSYKFLITYNKKIFPLVFDSKYSTKRRLLKDISVISDAAQKIICLKVKYATNEYPICYKNNDLVDYRLLNAQFLDKYFSHLIQPYNNEEFTEYKNIKIYNYFNKTFLIWNYKGYYLLNGKVTKTISLVNTDNYQNSLSIQNSNYLITPNYDENFFFSNIYKYDNKKQDFEKIAINHSISYNSYYLGYYRNDFYLLDRKNEVEYKFNAKKDKISRVDKDYEGIIFDKDWNSVSMQKLINNEYTFNYILYKKFVLLNNTLYITIDGYDVKIENEKVSKIVYQNDNEVFYLKNDILYVYSLKQGIIKLLKYNEWNFNNNKQIFIFN